MKYFRNFGSNWHTKRDGDFGKFDSRSDEGIFLGHFTKSKAYKCYNFRLMKIAESANLRVYESVKRFGSDYKCDIHEEDN